MIHIEILKNNSLNFHNPAHILAIIASLSFWCLPSPIFLNLTFVLFVFLEIHL